MEIDKNIPAFVSGIYKDAMVKYGKTHPGRPIYSKPGHPRGCPGGFAALGLIVGIFHGFDGSFHIIGSHFSLFCEFGSALAPLPFPPEQGIFFGNGRSVSESFTKS